MGGLERVWGLLRSSRSFGVMRELSRNWRQSGARQNRRWQRKEKEEKDEEKKSRGRKGVKAEGTNGENDKGSIGWTRS